MKIQTPSLVKNCLRVTQIGFLFAAVLTFGARLHVASAASWSGTSSISPALQPDPRGGPQQNDVAVNAYGDTIAAWDQYNFYTPVSASIGVATQSGGRWSSPFTISGNTTGFAMTPKVAIGADGTKAVSWIYQPDAYTPISIQVAVKPPVPMSVWTTYTLANFMPGGVSITRSVPVAIDASGNVTAAWNVWDGTRNVVQAATLPSGSNTWSATSTVSDQGHDGLYFSLAVNARGDAAVAYSLSPYTTYSTGTAAYYVSRNGPDGSWSRPVQISETLMSWVGYVTNPLVALDKPINPDTPALATVIYMGSGGLMATRENSSGSWTPPQAIVNSCQVDPPIMSCSGSSYMSPDLAVDEAGNALVAISIFDSTVNVDRSSVYVTRHDSSGTWTPVQRLTDPSVPVDAYATRVAVSPDGSLKMVGWIDHYHGTAQVAQWNGSVWNTATIGQGTAFASYLEVLSLDVGSGTVGRAIWKNSSSKKGIKIMATSYR